MSQSNDENVFSDDDLLTVNVQFPDQKFKISLTVVKAAELALHNENNKVEKPSGSSNDRFMMPSDSTINLLNSDSSSSDNKCDDCGAINFQECTCPDKICNNCSGSVCNCK